MDAKKFHAVNGSWSFKAAANMIKSKLNGSTSIAPEMIESLRYISITIHQAAREGLVNVVTRQIRDRPELINKQDSKNMTPLHYAAQFNRADVARELVEAGADANIRSREGFYALHLAAKFNSDDTAQVMMKHGINNEVVDTKGQTPLHISARKGHLAVVEVLLKFNAKTNCRDRDLITPLHLAVLSANYDVCKIMIGHNADVSAKEVNDITPFMLAASEGMVDVMELCIQNGVTGTSECVLSDYINFADNEGSNALHLAVQNNKRQAVEFCLDKGMDVNAQKENLQTSLHIAAVNGDMDIVKLLLQRGSNVQALDSDEMTPLHKAALFNRVDVAQELIGKGANIDAADLDEYTPLLCAVWKSQTDMVQHLLQNGANPTARDKLSKTCLHIAVEIGNKEVVDAIVKTCGKEFINLVDHMDNTSLHYAAKTGNTDAVSVLIEHSASPSARDHDEKTPFHLAAEAGECECLDLLFAVSNGEINDDDINGCTPLLLACTNGQLSAIKLLLSLGADISSRDDNRCTALMLCAGNGHGECMEYLLEHHADITAVDKNKNSALHHSAMGGHVVTTEVYLTNFKAPDFESTALHHATGAGGKDSQGTKNANMKTPLDLAVEEGYDDVAATLLSHDNWSEVMDERDEDGYSPLPILIKKMPDVAQIVLDKCVQYSHDDMEDPELQVTFDYNRIDPGPDDVTAKHGRYFALNDMVERNREDLLSHTLCQHILSRKWRKFGRTYFYFEIFAYVLFLGGITTWLVENEPLTTRHLDSAGCPIHGNDTQNETLLAELKASGDSRGTLTHDPLRHGTQLAVLCFVALSMLKELFRVINLKVKYFLDVSSYLFWIMYVCTLVFVLPIDYEPCFRQWSFGIISVMLSWINILFYLRGFEVTGIYVSMFLTVSWSLFKSMLIFSFLLVGFGLTYHIVLAKEASFASAGMSMLKVLAMFMGELDFTSVYVSADNEPFHEESYIIFVVFLFMIPIVLINLLIGISIGDIEQIRQGAYMQRLKLQVDLIYGIESTLPKFIQRHLYDQKITIEPNAGLQTRWAKFKRQIFGSSRSTEPFVKRIEMNTVENQIHDYGKRLNSLEKNIDGQRTLLKAIAEKMQVKIPY